ncbi:MAG: hypothetical protein AAF226_08395 [Verrucomicrobiota bacterium]
MKLRLPLFIAALMVFQYLGAYAFWTSISGTPLNHMEPNQITLRTHHRFAEIQKLAFYPAMLAHGKLTGRPVVVGYWNPAGHGFSPFLRIQKIGVS